MRRENVRRGSMETGAARPVALRRAQVELQLHARDGMETFALPDLRSRVPVGTGTAPGRAAYECLVDSR